MRASPESSTNLVKLVCLWASVCVRACVRALCLWGGVACEELDMSFRGIRHLKGEEVKATQLGIKHQATSAASSTNLTKTSARSFSIDLIFPWIYHLPLLGGYTPPGPGTHLSFFVLNVTPLQYYTGLNWQPQRVWVSCTLFLISFIGFINMLFGFSDLLCRYFPFRTNE